MSPRKRTFEAPPPRPQTEIKPPPRTLLMGEEEKRRMIEAHAARRVPMGRDQMVSLWAGVLICVVAIGAGWVYAMRNSIANAFQSSPEVTDQLKDLPTQVKEAFEEKKNQQGVIQDITQAKDALSQMQAAQGAEYSIKDTLTKAIKQAASGTQTETPDGNAAAKTVLPAGVKMDAR